MSALTATGTDCADGYAAESVQFTDVEPSSDPPVVLAVEGGRVIAMVEGGAGQLCRVQMTPNQARRLALGCADAADLADGGAAAE